MVGAFFTAFGAVFLAELPDKTMFASVVLTTRYKKPLAVWSGAAAAFSIHVILAVTLGSLLRKLPHTPLQIGVGVLFIVGGVMMWREGGERDEGAEGEIVTPPLTGFVPIALRAAAVLGLAEFGDLTQLATAGIASRTGEPIAVALGAWLALASVAGLAVVAGAWIERTLPMHVVRRVAAVLFFGFGAVAIVLALI
jgi:putative Ca2+/H+ antiporter (TMEM165/GDT1 family)